MNKNETTPVELSYERAMALVNQAIEERGEDYVNPKYLPGTSNSTGWVDSESWVQAEESTNEGACKYVINGTPSCIVGYVLHHAGIPVETMEEFDQLSSLAGAVMSRLEYRGLLKLEGSAYALLSQLQAFQDDGKPWGLALERARQSQ